MACLAQRPQRGRLLCRTYRGRRLRDLCDNLQSGKQHIVQRVLPLRDPVAGLPGQERSARRLCRRLRRPQRAAEIALPHRRLRLGQPGLRGVDVDLRARGQNELVGVTTAAQHASGVEPETGQQGPQFRHHRGQVTPPRIRLRAWPQQAGEHLTRNGLRGAHQVGEHDPALAARERRAVEGRAIVALDAHPAAQLNPHPPARQHFAKRPPNRCF